MSNPRRVYITGEETFIRADLTQNIFRLATFGLITALGIAAGYALAVNDKKSELPAKNSAARVYEKLTTFSYPLPYNSDKDLFHGGVIHPYVHNFKLP